MRFHPDLRAGRFIPPINANPFSTALINRIPPKTEPTPDDLIVTDVDVPGPPVRAPRSAGPRLVLTASRQDRSAIRR